MKRILHLIILFIPLISFAKFGKSGNEMCCMAIGRVSQPASCFSSCFSTIDTIANNGSINNKQKENNIPNDTLIDKLNDKLSAYEKNRIIEKDYLQFDKPYYAAGDTIYFKAYVVVGALHQLSALSKILYVDLIGVDNNIMESIVLHLTDGVAWGDFALKDTLKAGNYRIRAYTNWMRNEDNNYFFNKSIPVVNTTTNLFKDSETNNTAKAKGSLSHDSITAIKHFDVQFFPEGGHIINGNFSKIAFKAISADGLGTSIKGVIIDNEGHQLSAFNSVHLGMGLIYLKPQDGKSYKAQITFIDGSTQVFELPKASSAGYGMSIDNADTTQIKLTVTSVNSSSSEKLAIVAQSGGVIYYTAVGKFGINHSLTISKKLFPTGIIQFTLFLTNGEPVAERLLFINHNDQLKLSLTSDKPQYTARQKVRINLHALNNGQQPVTGIFSVAVTDETKVPIDDNIGNSILANILLTSDIKGYIERPNYYFEKESDTSRANLDLLMLTQGYHRFEWRQILNDQLPQPLFKPEKGIVLSGTIKSKSGKPLSLVKVSLLATNSPFFLLLDTLADKNGKFLYHLPDRAGITYTIQAADKKVRNNSLVELDNKNVPVNKSYNATDSSFKKESLSGYLQSSISYHQEQVKQGFFKNSIVLNEVSIINKKEPPKYLKHSSNLNGAGNADFILTADQLPSGCPVFTECLKGRLRGVTIISNPLGGVRVLSDRNYRTEMLIIVDGVEVSSSSLNTIDMNDIASIEVLLNASSAATYGVRALAGVLIVTTKRADDESPSLSYSKSFATYSTAEYYKARTFYSPKYDTPGRNVNFKDLRSTIYWNPNIITEENGEGSFEFYTSDGKGAYRIEVEGIDSKGEIGRQVYHFQVH